MRGVRKEKGANFQGLSDLTREAARLVLLGVLKG